MNAKFVILMSVVATVFAGCSGNEDVVTDSDISEPAQQIGDAMASIDESGGEGGSLASLYKSSDRMFARYNDSALKPTMVGLLGTYLLPQAQAVACGDASLWDSCSSNVITRNFSGCSVGSTGITISGSVTLTYDDANDTDNTCQMTSSGHSVVRDPSFTITGRRGSTLTVSKSGTVGQKIEKSGSSTFIFTNDGIRRVFSGALGASFDFETSTTGSGLLITGTSRSGRTLSSNAGGALRVTNNNSGVYCDYTPSSLTYSSSCNCATSGSWSGSCSDGKTPSLTITSCGIATFSDGTDSSAVRLDRCYAD